MKALVAVLSLSLLLFFSARVSSQSGVIDPELQTILETADPDQPLPIIVTLADRADLRNIRDRDKRIRRRKIINALRSHADRTQAPLLTFLGNNGGTRIVRLWAVNSIAATVPAKLIPRLARRPRVQNIRPDGTFSAPGTSGTTANPEWNIDAIHAPQLWGLGQTAQGVVVASMDTGVDVSHPDLSPRWRGGSNSWLDPYKQHSTPFDKFGHGTQIMGLMVGGNAGGTAIGVAPGARWIAVKIFNDAGQAQLSKVHQGFQWLLDPDGDPQTNDAPDVVNNSWGLLPANGCNLEFQSDIQALQAAEIAVVFSAGNEGPNSSTSVSPANYPESLSVGSVNSAWTIAGNSSRGPSACDGLVFPKLVAPGVNVNTADLYGFYISVSGTSAAAPHVSGALALLSGAFPTKTVAEAESALRESALDRGVPGPDNSYGYGLIDVEAAYNRLAGGLQNPIAVADAYSIDEDTTLAVAAAGGVLANDTDPQNYPLSAIPVGGPTHGTLALDPAGSFVYTPQANFSGTDYFTYKASDGALESAVTTVTITVNPINDAPVANNDSYTGTEDTPLSVAAPGVLGNDTDVDGDPLSAILAGGPTHGTLALDPAGSFVYTPTANFSGTDSFTYKASDGALESAVATVTITVNPVNDAPVASSVTATPNPTNGRIGVNSNVPAVRVQALLSGTLTRVAAAEAFIDAVGATGSGTQMAASDGTFDSLSETGFADFPLATILQLSNGSHTLSVRGRNAVGIWGGTSTATLVVDKVAPAISAINPSPATVALNAASVTLNITATDNGGSGLNGGYFWLDGTTTPPATTMAFSGTSVLVNTGALTAGTHMVRVRVKDAAGNLSAVSSVTLYVASAVNNAYSATANTNATPQTVNVTTTNGVLTNDQPTGVAGRTASLVAGSLTRIDNNNGTGPSAGTGTISVTLSANGSFSYTLTAPASANTGLLRTNAKRGHYRFTYTETLNGVTSQATVTITVN